MRILHHVNPMSILFDTIIGKIAAKTFGSNINHPILFLHGVFLDNTFWQTQIKAAVDHGYYAIALDMPFHGQSKDVKQWDMDDCGTMLVEIATTVGQGRKVTVVGQSWGGMTIIKALSMDSSKFDRAFLFNVPLHAATWQGKLMFTMQNWISTISTHFYGQQAAKSMYGQQALQSNPQIPIEMGERLTKMGSSNVSYTVQKVIIEAVELEPLLNQVAKDIPVKLAYGDNDYARINVQFPHELLKSSNHMSPEEVGDLVNNIIFAETK
jgi:3-oxoadipate enol-lactonase